jgi:hypothetical protein
MRLHADGRRWRSCVSAFFTPRCGVRLRLYIFLEAVCARTDILFASSHLAPEPPKNQQKSPRAGRKILKFMFLCCRVLAEGVHAAGRRPGHVVLHQPHGVGTGRQGAPAVRPIAAGRPPGQARHRPAHQGHQVQRSVHEKTLLKSFIEEVFAAIFVFNLVQVVSAGHVFTGKHMRSRFKLGIFLRRNILNVPNTHW